MRLCDKIKEIDKKIKKVKRKKTLKEIAQYSLEIAKTTSRIIAYSAPLTTGFAVAYYTWNIWNKDGSACLGIATSECVGMYLASIKNDRERSIKKAYNKKINQIKESKHYLKKRNRKTGKRIPTTIEK